MARFRIRATVQAITFDELVAIGREQNPGRVEMPWSFRYQGQPITHENDDCYLVPGYEAPGRNVGGSCMQRMERGCWLVAALDGRLLVLSAEEFGAKYERLHTTRADVECARADVRDALQRLVDINGADGTAAAYHIVLAEVENMVRVAARVQLTPCAATPCPFEGSIEVIQGSGDQHCEYHAQQLRLLLGERYRGSAGVNA